MKPILSLVLFVLFFAGSCKKEEPPKLELPPYSQEGKNVFACKINGEIFIAEGRSKCHFGLYTDRDSVIKIFALESNPKKATFGISFKLLNENSSPAILKNGMDSSAYVYIPEPGKLLAETQYFTNAEYTGNVEVKYYSSNIIAGVFEFDATDGEGNIVHITEGRFDVTQ